MAFAAVLLLTQSCKPKSEKENEENAAGDTLSVAKTEVVVTPAEKRAKRQQAATERAEKIKMEREEMAKTSLSYKDADGKMVYYKSEVEPVYPGGESAIRQFIQDNVQYPQQAQDAGIEATVFVDFIIGENGMVRNVEVTEVVGDEDPAFRTEAIRVVSAMPKWTSGKQSGKAVPAKYTLPISFELQ